MPEGAGEGAIRRVRAAQGGEESDGAADQPPLLRRLGPHREEMRVPGVGQREGGHSDHHRKYAGETRCARPAARSGVALAPLAKMATPVELDGGGLQSC